MLGRGKIEDFTWKGYLDFTTCTECGRCQSQCPAWNTGKPLSPKLVIMDLRDHLFAKAPYILGDKDSREPRRGPGPGTALTRKHASHACPSPASSGSRVPGPSRPPARSSAPLEQGGVIDPDVLWSCTTCGACVEQCPVDIEHIDHIVDMRRYQVMVESEFPGELSGLFKNLETKRQSLGPERQGPHQVDRRGRLRRAGVRQGRRLVRRLRVPVLGGLRGRPRGPREEDHQGRRRAARHRGREVSSCSARARPAPATRPAAPATSSCSSSWPPRTSRPSTACSRASRRSIARSSSPARTASTRSGREYPQLGGNYTVLHHTQLLNRLVRDKKLVPVSPVEPGRHLSRPVLPGQAQQGLRGAARADRGLGRQAHRDAAARRPRPVLRCGRCADVDGRAHRQARQPRTRRRGAGHRRIEDRDRLPVLPRDDDRRRRRRRRGDGQAKAEVLDVAQLLLGSGQGLGHVARQGRGCKGIRGARRPRRGLGTDGRSRAGGDATSGDGHRT